MISPPPQKQNKKKDDKRQAFLRTLDMSARDKLISTTKVETFREMIHGGTYQGGVSEGSFGNKKPVPTMISAGARPSNASGMIQPRQSPSGMIQSKPSSSRLVGQGSGNMIQKSANNPSKMIQGLTKPTKSKQNGRRK
jgi:hypothetical protein